MGIDNALLLQLQDNHSSIMGLNFTVPQLTAETLPYLACPLRDNPIAGTPTLTSYPIRLLKNVSSRTTGYFKRIVARGGCLKATSIFNTRTVN